jgi:hypothetical protein
MTKKLFDYDPITNTTKWWHYDAAKDEAVIETVSDVSAVLEQNKATYAQVDERAKWGEWAHVAQIPMSVYWELKSRGIVDDPTAMKKWLNDPDNKFFRTRPGKV